MRINLRASAFSRACCSFEHDGVDLTAKEDATAALRNLYGMSRHMLQNPWIQREANTFAAWEKYFS